MKLVSPDDKGVFTFRSEDTDREVVFVKGAAIVADRESNHCSVHTFYASGCTDCTNAALLRELTFKKGAPLPSILWKAHLTHATHPLAITPSVPSAKIQMVRQQFDAVLNIFLTNSAIKAAKAAGRKAYELKKADIDDEQAIYDAALNEIYWDDIIADTVVALTEAASQGVSDATSQLGVEVNAEQAKQLAVEYAKTRAASMVGKKITSEGIIDNPSAQWAISNTTRDDLQDIISEALDKNVTIAELEDSIRTAGTFSAARATMIAKTEIAMAQVRTNLNIWKSSGIVKTVNVVLSADHKQEDNCDLVAGAGPYAIATVPLLPLHPSCLCGYQAIEISL